MSQRKLKPSTKTKKSFLITIDEDKEGRRFTGISPRGPITPPEMLDALLDSLSAVYLNIWGGRKGEGILTPEEFCQTMVTKTMARLAHYEMKESTVQ